VLLAVTSIALFLIAAWLFLSTHACGGQCSAPWVYQVNFPQGTSQVVIENALERCADLPVVTSVDPKVTDLYGPHVMTSSREQGQIRQLDSCLKSGGAMGIDFPD